MTQITSPQNEHFKYWKSLIKGKGLKEGNHFLLSGSKLVKETLRDPQWTSRIQGVLLPPKMGVSKQRDFSNHPCFELAATLFHELDVLGTHEPLLLIEQPNPDIWTPDQAIQGLELLCPFGDPQNLGALIRTAYAFGVSRVVLLKEAANPWLPKSIKASSGAILKMPVQLGPSIHEITSPAVALDLEGTPLGGKTWPQNLRLLLGEEGPGVPKAFSGERLTLPMKNPMESLNAAVATGIVIYELTRSRSSSGFTKIL